MKKGKEIRSRFFALNPRFNYLPDEDRYLFARGNPKYHFNLIGAGINGQEHIRITKIEGRASIRGIYDPNPRSLEWVYGFLRPDAQRLLSALSCQRL